MSKLKLGIIGTSEIALRRFLPALAKHPHIEYVGVGTRTPQKAKIFVENFGGKIYESYDKLIHDPTIDLIYAPLPPSLHYEWGKKSLLQGKHLLLEKPSTIKLSDTKELITLAKEKNLALHENYMFLFHKQLAKIQELLQEQVIGNIREYRIDFGFPKRNEDDFRYNKILGGGALLDCGGYAIKLATILLGGSTTLTYSKLNFPQGYDIDLYGSAVLENKQGCTAHIAFGMDNAYKCDLEIWGSLGMIKTDRIFTAPDDFSPQITIKKGNKIETIVIEPDDQFYHSIDHFYQCINDSSLRVQNYDSICRQSKFIEQMQIEEQ